jgi:cytochrome c-type biogenesis protein CcmH
MDRLTASAARWTALIGALLAAVFLAISPVHAQDATPAIPDDAVNAIAKQMYCPVCENIPLDVCGTQACHQWRELIRQRLAEGWTEQEIKDDFVRQYGDRVLAEPPAEGFNWLVYIIPPALILAGIVLVARLLRMWRATPHPVQSSQGEVPEVDERYVRRLEEELRKRGS